MQIRQERQQQEQQESDESSSSSSSSRTSNAARTKNHNRYNDHHDEPQKPLEVCLLEAGILQEARVPEQLLHMPLAELEVNLWLALDAFLKRSRTPVSPVLLGLLPVGQAWPSEFVLERIADTLQGYSNNNNNNNDSDDDNSNNDNSNNNTPSSIQHKYRRVSPLYPSLRRQKRLAYGAAQLLERHLHDTKNSLRQQLLQIPSTKLRLAYLLDQFDRHNDSNNHYDDDSSNSGDEEDEEPAAWG